MVTPPSSPCAYFTVLTVQSLCILASFLQHAEQPVLMQQSTGVIRIKLMKLLVYLKFCMYLAGLLSRDTKELACVEMTGTPPSI